MYNIFMRINPNRSNKKCSMCKEIKDREYFYKDRNRVDGMSNYCKSCTSSKNKKWREENHYTNAESALWTRRKIFYGITKEEFYGILKDQGHKCKICNVEVDKSSHVDHCHSSGVVRGILCLNCNKGLGFFKDNIDNLKNAIEYLKG